MPAAPLDESTETLALFRNARALAVTRTDDGARLTLALPDAGPALVVRFERCTELRLVPVGGGAPIDDPAALTALGLQLLDAQIIPTPSMAVFAWTPGPVRGGGLHVRAGAVTVTDEAGARVPRGELLARLDAARRARAEHDSATEYRKAFDRVLKRDVRPRLVGFHAERRSLLRVREGLVDLFETELGRFASPEALDITLVVSLYVGAVSPKAKLDEVSRLALPVISRRLEPPYRLTARIDEVELAARLVDDVERVALPFFDQVHGPDDVVALLAEEDRRSGGNARAFALAELLARLGRLDEARPHYLRSPGDRDAIRRAAAHHGITLDDDASN